MKKLIHQTFATLALIALAVSFAVAQRGGAPAPQGPSMKGADIKGKAPVNKEILKVKLPKGEEATLPNGLRVIVLEGHRVPTFTMQMVVLSGGLSDPADYHGLSSFTAALLREGTRTRKSKDIAEQTDTIGATLTAGSGLSTFTTNVTTTGLVDNFDQALELFADVILNPTFPQEEVDKFKARQLQQMMFQRSLPQFLAQERFQRAIYGDHPAGMVTPPIDSIRKISSADLAAFQAKYYRPNNAILAIVGDVTLKELMPKITRAFGGWEKGDVPSTNVPSAPAQGSAQIQLINRPGSVQTVLQLGALGIERTNPDYFAVAVMNQILGGGPTGRLFMNLREDKGYTYGAYSSFGGSKYRGTVNASSEVRTDVTEGAMKEFMYELNRMRDEKVSATELDNAKRAIVGSFALSLEQPAALLNNIVILKLYDMPADYWDTYPAKIMAITDADVQRVAQKYLDMGHLQVVAVGDATKTRTILAKYGTVQEYDAEGKPVKN
jgi:predicted Zn-dependent peptidase